MSPKEPSYMEFHVYSHAHTVIWIESTAGCHKTDKLLFKRRLLNQIYRYIMFDKSCFQPALWRIDAIWSPNKKRMCTLITLLGNDCGHQLTITRDENRLLTWWTRPVCLPGLWSLQSSSGGWWRCRSKPRGHTHRTGPRPCRGGWWRWGRPKADCPHIARSTPCSLNVNEKHSYTPDSQCAGPKRRHVNRLWSVIWGMCVDSDETSFHILSWVRWGQTITVSPSAKKMQLKNIGGKLLASLMLKMNLHSLRNLLPPLDGWKAGSW